MSSIKRREFRQGLRKLGWTEGHNVGIDIRYSHLLDDLLAIFLTVVGGLDAPGRHRIKGCVHPRCAPLRRPGNRHRIEVAGGTSANLFCMAASLNIHISA